MLRSVRGLGVPLGGCERIQGTPLPFVYVAHLRSFLLVVLCGVPIVYGCEWRWATIPLALLIALALLGIEAASVECERPFDEKPSKNHHDLERFAELISTEVLDMLKRSTRLSESGPLPNYSPQPLASRLQKQRTLYGLSSTSEHSSQQGHRGSKKQPPGPAHQG